MQERYPSYLQTEGSWNVSNTCPKLTYREFENVKRALMKRMKKYGGVNDLDQPDLWIVPDWLCDDRTHEINIIDYAKLSAGLVRDLQGVLAKYPLWRVIVYPSPYTDATPEDVIVIYPEVVRVVCAEEGEPLEEVVRKVRQRWQERKGCRMAYRKRRMEELKPLLPGAYQEARLSEKNVHLVACFDTQTEGTPGKSVWLIFVNARSVFDLDEYYVSPPVSSSGMEDSLYWLFSDGSLFNYADFDFKGDPEALLLLNYDLYTLDNHGEIDFKRPNTTAHSLRVEKDGEAWEFNLTK
jgi:hypothetical protein